MPAQDAPSPELAQPTSSIAEVDEPSETLDRLAAAIASLAATTRSPDATVHAPPAPNPPAPAAAPEPATPIVATAAAASVLVPVIKNEPAAESQEVNTGIVQKATTQPGPMVSNPVSASQAATPVAPTAELVAPTMTPKPASTPASASTRSFPPMQVMPASPPSQIRLSDAISASIIQSTQPHATQALPPKPIVSATHTPARPSVENDDAQASHTPAAPPAPHQQVAADASKASSEGSTG